MDNKNLESQILIEVKVIFATALGKLLATPEPVKTAKSLALKTREVSVPTTHAGTGNNY
jgi:hypothetical protein